MSCSARLKYSMIEVLRLNFKLRFRMLHLVASFWAVLRQDDISRQKDYGQQSSLWFWTSVNKAQDLLKWRLELLEHLDFRKTGVVADTEREVDFRASLDLHLFRLKAAIPDLPRCSNVPHRPSRCSPGRTVSKPVPLRTSKTCTAM